MKNIVALKSRLWVTHPANLCTFCASLNCTDPGLYVCLWQYGPVFIRLYTASSGKRYTGMVVRYGYGRSR